MDNRREKKLRIQEAQLPLRNRASAMYFFVAKLLSIAVMTYSYVYHLRNLRPANLLRTQRINFSMRGEPLRNCEYLLETNVPELHDSCYSIRLSVFTFTQ